MNKIFIAILVFIFLAIVTYCGYQLWLVDKVNYDVSVGLKWKHQAQFAGEYIADYLGYYKKSGLNVDFVELDPTISQIDSLINGELDFMLMSPEEFLLHVDSGKDIKAVAMFYQTSPLAIVSLAKSGIKTPADFVGKKLGIKGGKLEEKIIYLLMLDQFGIKQNEVEMKNIGFEKTEINDLLDGDVEAVDLYRTDQLYWFEKNKVDYNIIYPENFGINTANDILVTTNKLIRDNPEIVRSFVRDTVMGWEYAIKNPNKAIDITMNYVTNDSYKDIEYEKYILNNSIPLIKLGTSQDIGYINYSYFNKLYKSLKSHNFLNKDFNVVDFYTNNFLK